jgi:hypothetical protein
MKNMSKRNDLLDLFLLRTNEDGVSSSSSSDDAPSTTRLDSSATLDFLTLRDLYQLRSVSKRTFSALKTVEYTRCRDGCDYAVPFPAYPGILCTESDRKLGAGLFRHQLASLAAMHKAENNNVSFGSLRGGILGDAPGLGKTITMLSLIVNTAGLRPVEPEEFYDNQSIAEHWKLMRVNPVFRTEILKSIKPLRGASNYDELARYVSPPFLDDDRFPTLVSFERHVNRQTANKVPRAQLDLFRRNVVLFKAGLDKRNRRFFSNDKGRRMVFERNLVPCSTTLIIVPDALLEHWAEQIRRHVKLDVFGENCGSDDGVVYIDGVGDLSRARFPLNHRQMSLPSMFDLVNYLMVVVPFSRIKQQYYLKKRRRKEDVVDLTVDDNGSESSPLLQLRWFRIVVDEGHELGANEAGNDVCTYVNTLAAERRWVMSGTPTTGDEDSVEFNDIGLTQLQRLLLFLRHEKYGITRNQFPEKQSNRGGGAATGGGGRKHDNATAKSEWDKMVKIPFLKKQHAGREELFCVLKEVMVMHKKEDIGLPKPIFKQGEVTVQIPQEVGSHIVNAVQTNEFSFMNICEKLMIGPFESHDDSNHNESERQYQRKIRQRKISLLEQKIANTRKVGGSTLFDTLLHEHTSTIDYQSKIDTYQAEYIEDAIKRERKELECRGGAIADLNSGPLTAASDHFNAETFIDRRPIKAVVYSSSTDTLPSVLEYLYDKFGAENIAELTQGKIDVMAYELGRFRLGRKEGKHCSVCNGWNEYSGKELYGCRRLLLEVADADDNVFLIEPERILRAVGEEESVDCVGNKVKMDRLGGAPLNKYGISHKYWKVGDALCIDARDPHPLFHARWNEDQWAGYGSAKCKELVEMDGGEGMDNYFGPLPSEEGNDYGRLMVRLRKWQYCGKFHRPPRWSNARKKQVGWYTGPTLAHQEMTTIKEDVFILALDASLAHGLDLSFVTHLFLLEPIDDAALLEQVRKSFSLLALFCVFYAMCTL